MMVVFVGVFPDADFGVLMCGYDGVVGGKGDGFC